MEGVLTCALAIFGYFVIVRFPDEEKERPSYRFLKPEECEYVLDRLDKDRSDVELEKFNFVKYVSCANNIEIWGFALMFL